MSAPETLPEVEAMTAAAKELEKLVCPRLVSLMQRQLLLGQCEMMTLNKDWTEILRKEVQSWPNDLAQVDVWSASFKEACFTAVSLMQAFVRIIDAFAMALGGISKQMDGFRNDGYVHATRLGESAAAFCAEYNERATKTSKINLMEIECLAAAHTLLANLHEDFVSRLAPERRGIFFKLSQEYLNHARKELTKTIDASAETVFDETSPAQKDAKAGVWNAVQMLKCVDKLETCVHAAEKALS